MKKKLLVRAYTKVNLGDDLFLKILVERYPDIEFSLLVDYPIEPIGIYSYYRQVCCIRYFERLFIKVLRRINVSYADKIELRIFKRRITRIASDYLGYVHIGGSIFIQQSPGVDKSCIRNIFLYKTFKHSLIIGANFGPILDDEYLDFYKTALCFCESVVFRDSYSKSLFPPIPSIMSAPDIVFQMKPNERDIIPDSVGFSILDLKRRKNLMNYSDSYKRFIKEAIRKLHKKGKRIFLFSFCKIEGDEDFINELLQDIQEYNVSVVTYNGNVDSFLKSYSSVESMFCTRFHSMILSLVYNQKFIPILYSDKMKYVLDDIAYEGRPIQISEIGNVNCDDVIRDLNHCSFTLQDDISKSAESMFYNLDMLSK